MGTTNACLVSIEVDGRQKYIFETDKWQEILGASRIVAETVGVAEGFFKDELGLHLLSPVSGDIRAWAAIANRPALLDAVWKMRRWLSERGVEHTCGYLETDARHFEGKSEVGVVPADRIPKERASLAEVYRRMTGVVGSQKSAKIGSDRRPVCSLFAPCRLHGLDFATEWRPYPRPGEPNEPRRRQRGWRAREKQSAWLDSRDGLYDEMRVALEHELRAIGVPDPPKVLDDLKDPNRFDFSSGMDDEQDGQRDQYVALVCADGDRFGSEFLKMLDWNSAAWRDDSPAWQRNWQVFEAINECVLAAFRSALAKVAAAAIKHDLARRKEPLIPALLQLVGGDDLWVLCRRDLALDLAAGFSASFSEHAGAKDILARAIKVARLNGSKMERLTMSVGVAFAKAGFPIHAMIENAESLMGNAKRERADLASKEAFVDWHWIQSSLSESVDAAREHGWRVNAFEDDLSDLELTSRPWTLAQVAAMLKAHGEIQPVPRGKLQLLEDILRMGYTPSLLAWEGWWKSLTGSEVACLNKARVALADAGIVLPPATQGRGFDSAFLPWHVFKSSPVGLHRRTPWLDLLALEDVLKNGGTR